MFENKVLRRMFGPKRDDVTAELRKVHNEELHYFVLILKRHYVNHIKENEVGWECGRHGRGQKSVQNFGRKARRKETTWKTEA
jgi:hypothetical protein